MAATRTWLMASAKLTSRTVSAVKPRAALFIVFDTELPGFGLRVMPTGYKSWIVEYRPVGAARDANKKRLSLGSAAVLTATKARNLAKDTLAGIRKGEDPLVARQRERNAVTVAALAERFLTEHAEKRLKPATATLYRRTLEIHVLPRLGTRRAESITKQDVAKLHADIAAGNGPGKPRVASRSGERRPSKRGGPIIANRAVAALGSMYAWAMRPTRELVEMRTNPASGVERTAEQSRERFLSMEELERLGRALRDAETIGLPWEVDEAGQKSKHLAKAKNRRTILSPHAVAAIRLLVLTGCRLREILHLRWTDVDTERGMLHLQDSKTGRKSVVLNAPALQVLADIPRIGEFVIAGKPPRRRKTGTAKERPRADLKKPWETVRRTAGLDGVRIHDLRHSFASVGAGAGLGLPIVGKLLGHTQAATTQKYAHLDNDPLRKASNTIGATIAAALDGKTSGNVTPIHGGRRAIQKSRG